MEKLTAAEYRAKAEDAQERNRKSWENSDTDGFLSQWASSVAQDEYAALAQLADDNWMSEFETLVDAHGALVPCRKINTKFGISYGVFASFDDAENRGEVIQWVGTGQRAAKNKGYQIAKVRTEARIKLSEGLRPTPHRVPVAYVLTPENCTIVEILG